MLTNACLHQTFNAFPLASLLLKADAPDFTIIDANTALLEVSNTKSVDLLIGKSIFEAFPDNPNDIDANGVSKLKASLCKTVETGIVQEMPPQRYDIEIANTKRYIVKYWSVKNIPLLNEDGSVGSILHTTVDVTDSILVQQKEDELLAKINPDINFSSSLETINEIGSWDLDLETGDFYWSPEFFEICGYAPNAFTPSLAKALEIIYVDDHEIVTEAFNNAIERGVPYRIEHRIITNSNKVATVLATGIITKNKEGKHIRLTGFFQNITAQKHQGILLTKTFETLIDSEKRYKQLFENNPSPMYLWDFKTLQIIDCNEEALLLYGYTKEEFLQFTLRDLRLAEDIAELEKLTLTEDDCGKINKKIWRHKKKNGEIVHVYVVGHLFEQNDRKVVLVCVNDITEKKKTEEALKDSEAKYRSLFENSMDATMFTTPDGHILEANAAACNMLQLTEEEICKAGRNGILDATDKRIEQFLHERAKNGSVKINLRYKRKNGELFETETSSTVYIDKNGVNRSIVTSKDITETLKAEQALKESEARYRLFFENGNNANFLAKADGTIIVANQMASKLFGYSLAELCTMKRKELADLSDPRVIKLIKEKETTGYATGIHRMFHKDGHTFEAFINSNIYFDANGEERHALTVKDLSEQQKAELAIKESEARYRLFFENGNNANFISTANGDIIAANQMASSMLGYSITELCQMNSAQLCDLADPRLITMNIEKDAKGSIAGIHTILHKNGHTFDAYSHSNLYYDANGEERYAIVVKDLSEQQKAELAIKESEARYRSFFENGINAHLICNANGDIIVANQMASNMFGYSTAELCRMNRSQIADMTDPRLLKLIRDKEVYGNAAGIHRFFHKNGQAFDGFLRSNIYLDATGEERTAITIKDLSEQQKAEQALAESDRKYRLLFYKSPIPKWIYEIGTFKIIDANEAALEHYGYTREEFLTLTILDLRPKNEMHKLFNIISKTDYVDGLSKAGKFIHKKKNGRLITVDIFSVLLDYEGKKCKLIIANDVTDVEYALKEMALSNERYHYVTRATTDAIWDWDLKNDTILFGDGFENIFGYQSGEKAFSINFLLDNIHPDDKQQMVDIFYKIVKSNVSQCRDEFRFKKADGSYAYVVNKGIVIRNALGKTIRIVGGMRDITAHKKELLRLQLLESVVTNTSDMVVITEAEPIDGIGPRIIYVNEAFTIKTGYTLEEVIGKTPRILQGPKTDRKELDRLKVCLEKWETCNITIINYTKNGEEFWVNMSISPVADANGWFTHFISVERDITEKVQHESDIIKTIIKTQEEERYEIGGELHDNVCQILTSSKIAFKMIEKSLPENKLSLFNNGIERLNLAFKEIRNLSHRLAPAFFDDTTLEQAFIATLKAFNVDDNFKILLQFDDAFKDYPATKEFQLNLHRILQEQLSNILKYAQATTIIVEGYIKNKHLVLSISDDGVGFDSNKIITGIGLSNMKRRAELFNGKFLLDTAPSKGCTLTIEIPLKDVD